MIDKPNFGLLKKHLPSSRFLLNRLYTKGLRHGRGLQNTSLTPPVTPSIVYYFHDLAFGATPRKTISLVRA